MKNRYKPVLKWMLCAILVGGMYACDDYLDVTPPTAISPEQYFTKDSELKAFVDGMYADILPSHGGTYSYGIFGWDSGTDNQVGEEPNSRYIGNTWHTGTGNGEYEFKYIRRCNYFFHYVLPKFEAEKLEGNEEEIRHYIGEVYFLRACEYFNRYQKFGDFPIVKKMLADDREQLIAESKRYPRNEVARFILGDLDRATELLSDNVSGVKEKTRISKDAAILLKSRVALFEGTWLKYHEEYVPGGAKWCGKTLNPDYHYPAGSHEEEIKYFLTRSYQAADSIASKYELVQNTGTVRQSETDPINPYMEMYATTDMSKYSEVILWRPYSNTFGVFHSVGYNAQVTNNGIGVTRSLVNNFLMSDGYPVYASPNFTYSEEGIAKVRQNRDARLFVWLKEPGQTNYFLNMDSQVGEAGQITEPKNPSITGEDKGKAVTGYILRLGNSNDKEQNRSTGGSIGSPSYMASEAYLNYMEAYYLLNGMGGKVKQYWTSLRQKHANITTDIDVTITATDMSKEVSRKDRNYDWGAYTGGSLLIDKTLYNIRRERRCELMAMGLRYMDLCRWRSMDQLKENKFHVEGFQLWDGNGKIISSYSYRRLLSDPDNPKSTVSGQAQGNFLCPYEIHRGNSGWDGLGWYYAYYLQYIPTKQFMLCGDGILYQNPGWTEEANAAPEF